MPDIKKYAFVLDAEGKQLDPTIEQNAWRQVRQHKGKSWCRGSLWLSNCNKVLFKGTIEQRKDVKKT